MFLIEASLRDDPPIPAKFYPCATRLMFSSVPSSLVFLLLLGLDDPLPHLNGTKKSSGFNALGLGEAGFAGLMAGFVLVGSLCCAVFVIFWRARAVDDVSSRS